MHFILYQLIVKKKLSFRKLEASSIQKFGYLPERDEKINFDGFEISILRADSRQIHTILAKVNLKDLHEENK